MIWLTWRQHRLQLLIGAAALILLAPILVMTGREVAQRAQAGAICGAPCGDARSQMTGYLADSKVLLLLLVLPLLLGVFVGAPLLAHEQEQHTHLMAWTQGVSRTRWLASKLGILLGLSVLAAVMVDLLMTWWSAPIDGLLGPWPTFDVRGLAPLAYAVFALALGIAAGTLIRQTVAAMATTLAVFGLVRLAVTTWLRPRYLPPLQDTQLRAVLTCLNPPTCTSFHQTVPSGANPYQTAWVLQQSPLGGVDPGKPIVHLLLTVYQPASRFWLFQGIEAAIFLLLTVALIVLTVWWVRRRVT